MTATMAEIVAALACGRTGCPCVGAAKKGTGRTHCPAHDDSGPSLNVSQREGRVLVKCFAGCGQEAVVAGLRERGLWAAAPRQRKATRTAAAKETVYRIEDANGVLVAEHVRIEGREGKRFAWRRNGQGGLTNLRVSQLPLYGVRSLAARPGEPVVVTEGEKAADALQDRGLVAVGTVTGAASTPGDDALLPLLGRAVYLWPDNDEPGREHIARIAARLHALGCADVRAIEWAGAPEKGDAADFEGGEEELRELLAKASPWGPGSEGATLDGAEVLDNVRAAVTRFVVVTAAQADALALYVAHTHAFEAADATPYISIGSAEKRSGKSRLLEVLALLVANAWMTGRVSPAVLVRKVEKDTPTLLLDESDAAFKGDKEYAEALRGVLNAGHRRGGVASLCVKVGQDFEPRDFAVFGPKVIAGIGKLPDTVADRSIRIQLKRRARSERVERFRHREAQAALSPIKAEVARWASVHVNTLTAARPEIPEELDDRAADGWEPLLAIADLAGGEWPERARRAAMELLTGESREDDSLGVRLLTDIKAAMEGAERLTTAALLTRLHAMDDAPWASLRGEPLDARGLARFLKPYGVKSRNIRLGEGQGKGYTAGDFADAWARYVPSDAIPPVAGTAEESASGPGFPVAGTDNNGLGTDGFSVSVPVYTRNSDSINSGGTDGTDGTDFWGYRTPRPDATESAPPALPLEGAWADDLAAPKRSGATGRATPCGGRCGRPAIDGGLCFRCQEEGSG